MTKPDKKCPRQMAEEGYNIGDLVMVHGVNLGIITMYYQPTSLWLIKLTNGLELALFTEDFEPLKLKENINGNDDNGKVTVCPGRR
mgnify:CR=1 FL=1